MHSGINKRTIFSNVPETNKKEYMIKVGKQTEIKMRQLQDIVFGIRSASIPVTPDHSSRNPIHMVRDKLIILPL